MICRVPSGPPALIFQTGFFPGAAFNEARRPGSRPPAGLRRGLLRVAEVAVKISEGVSVDLAAAE